MDRRRTLVPAAFFVTMLIAVGCDRSERTVQPPTADRPPAIQISPASAKATELEAMKKLYYGFKGSTVSLPASGINPAHSAHGGAYNEGPRQKAVEIKGTGNVDFVISTENPELKKWFNQGVGLLHGFWTYEAERTFRQAAGVDPQHPMPYWGMAMANTLFFAGNPQRANDFLRDAVARMDKASDREAWWIHSLAALYEDGPAGLAERRLAMANRLQKLTERYPDDVEAKAFLVVTLFENNDFAAYGNSPIDREVCDRLIQDVLNKFPGHPGAHHYRIHLWNFETPERALEAARLAGLSAPDVAHMWHMPGHIYSQPSIARFHDVAYHQEASARVDHAQMARYGVLPYEIHNYAHNNSWLVATFAMNGTVHRALELAKNLMDLPRHPRLNNSGRMGSAANAGQARLIETLEMYGLWRDAVKLQAEHKYLEPAEGLLLELNRLRLIAAANFRAGDRGAATHALNQLKVWRGLLAGKSGPEFEELKGINQRSIHMVEAHRALKDGDPASAAAELAQVSPKKLSDAELGQYVQLLLDAGKQTEALEQARLLESTKRVYGMLTLANVYANTGDLTSARKILEDNAQKISPGLDPLRDAMVPLMYSTAKTVALSGMNPKDLYLAPLPTAEEQARPTLNTLGPIHWKPTEAPDFELTDATGASVRLSSFRGKPVVLVFYLGAKCVHCDAQLSEFIAQETEFKNRGYEVLTISPETPAEIATRAATSPFKTLSNADLSVYKAYGAYGDFDGAPLHGTFLIDPDGKILWQDRGPEPFSAPDAKDEPSYAAGVEFLLQESKRLLK